jgi:arylsulfatase A-like enzyme
MSGHGLDKDTLVIFTSGHGEWLGDRRPIGGGDAGREFALNEWDVAVSRCGVE